MVVELSKAEAGWCQLEAQYRHLRCFLACKSDLAQIEAMLPLERHGQHVKAEWAALVALGFSMPRSMVHAGRVANFVRVFNEQNHPFVILNKPTDDDIVMYVRENSNRHYHVVGWTTIDTVIKHGQICGPEREFIALHDSELFTIDSFPYEAVKLPRPEGIPT